MSSPPFSPTSAVRNSSCQWMEGNKTTVSINNTALDKFSNTITQTILSNKSLEVTEWDTDGWHYTGSNYYQRKKGGDAEVVQNNATHHELMRMERVALYILTLDAINFCFWPTQNRSDDDNDGILRRNGLEYEHLAIALRKVSEVDDDNELQDTTKQASRIINGDESVHSVHAASSYALNPTNLAALTPDKLYSMLHPHFPSPSKLQKDGVLILYELPNIEVRCKLLNELGNGLLKHHNGSALHMIAKADQSADLLVSIILDTFPGFHDFVDIKELEESSSASCDWESAKSSPTVIHFYKRAQIAVSDLWAALGRQRQQQQQQGDGNSSANTTTSLSCLQICQFNDMNLVTTFPDYRVPQILRHMNVLLYKPALALLVDNQVEIPKACIDEVSIRAGTVVAVEKLVKIVKRNILTTDDDITDDNSDKRSQSDMQKLADDVTAVTIDWYLWQQGERSDRLNLLGPHHRTRTTFY